MGRKRLVSSNRIYRAQNRRHGVSTAAVSLVGRGTLAPLHERLDEAKPVKGIVGIQNVPAAPAVPGYLMIVAGAS